MHKGGVTLSGILNCSLVCRYKSGVNKLLLNGMADKSSPNIHFSATLVCHSDKNKQQCTENQSQFKGNRQIINFYFMFSLTLHPCIRVIL
jgi:hypothetical protein